MLSGLSLHTPTPIPAPGMLSTPPPHLRRRQEPPAAARTPSAQPPPRSSARRAPVGGGSYHSPAPGSAPAPRVAPPRSLQLPRSLPGTARRPRAAASKPVPKGRGGKREAGSQACPALHTHPGESSQAFPDNLGPRQPSPALSPTPPPRADPACSLRNVPAGVRQGNGVPGVRGRSGGGGTREAH